MASLLSSNIIKHLEKGCDEGAGFCIEYDHIAISAGVWFGGWAIWPDNGLDRRCVWLGVRRDRGGFRPGDTDPCRLLCRLVYQANLLKVGGLYER